MAQKKVSAQTPANTDVLGINDIINQKIDVPAGQQLTYFPITGAIASSSVANQGPLFVLDSSPDTYWQPSDQVAGAHIELTCPNAYECYGVDIKFKESENKKFNLKVDILDKVNNRWLTVAVAESSTIDDNKYERFQAAQHFKSDTYRIIINSVFDTTTGHLYTQPKITQIRLFGLVPNEDVIKYKNNITKDQQVCPDGYGKDAESGQCVKSIPSEIIKPQTIDAKSSAQNWQDEPEGNDPENLLSVNPNDKLTLKGLDSYIEYGLSKNNKIYAVYIHKLNNPVRQYTTLVTFYNGEDKQPFYSFIVDIPDSQDKYVHILNEPLRADRFRLSVSENTEPQQLFSLLGLYLIGEPNVPIETEPPIPKSCSIKKGGWGSKSDNKPEEWTVKEMGDKDKKGKWKGVGADDKNVFHLCDSKEDAEAFIKRKIWESKQTKPPTEPPVEPPTTGGDSIALVYPIKQGGQVVTKFAKPDRSSHNTGTRDSFYSDPKSYYDAVNSQIGGYFKTKLGQDDQLSIKILSGEHGDSNPEHGNCYVVGLQVNPGKPTTPHLAKEIKHPHTPKFPKKVQLLYKKDLPDVNDKCVGLRCTSWVTPEKTFKGRLDIDISVLDQDPEKLTTVPNQWIPYFEFEDKGDWEGPVYTKNQGGVKMGFYIRFDKVTYTTKYNFLQCVEIVPPTTAPTAITQKKK